VTLPRLLQPRVVGRYVLYDEIAAGGMATVHYGRLRGPVGFSRTVAIKRLHPQFAKDPEFVSMFLDEGRLASRIRHPNVVQTLDVVALDGEVFLIMEHVMGETLSRLGRESQSRGQPVPLPVVSAILCGMLHGLHAAHEATSDRGEPLGIVHRDVSPQNVIVGAEGVARVLDFGVAKAAGQAHATREGHVKGKLPYMAPEQLDNRAVDRRTDVYAAGVVLWETLTLQRLFGADSEGGIVRAIFDRLVEPPGKLASGIPRALDQICLRALQRDPRKRFDSARQMALAIEAAVPMASTTRTAEWVELLAEEVLSGRSRMVAAIESSSDGGAGDAPLGVTSAGMEGSAPTQVSGLSISSVVRAKSAPAPLWARLVLGGGAAGVIAVGAGALAIQWERANRTAPAAVATSASPSQPQAPASATADRSLALESVSATPPSPASTSADSLTAPNAPLSPSPSTRRAIPSFAHPRQTPHGAAKPCEIRSFIDDAGIKTFVEDCK
jgi:serine/threonine protein kinase